MNHICWRLLPSPSVQGFLLLLRSTSCISAAPAMSGLTVSVVGGSQRAGWKPLPDTDASPVSAVAAAARKSRTSKRIKAFKIGLVVVLVTALLACLLAFIFIPVAQNPVLPHRFPEARKMATEIEEPTAVRAIAEGNAGFGLRMYESVREEKEGGNLVMSPYSASSVMAMATVGARGETREEMREGMQFPGEKEMVAGYSNAFGVLRGNENFTLETANRLFVQEGYQLLEEFVKVMEEKFYADAAQTDFAASEVARKLINDWVEEKTKEKIKDLIPEGVLNGLTRLVLVNAIYFKGDWASKFDKEGTWEADFHVGEDKVVKAQLMHDDGTKFKMIEVENLNSKAIELPYKGDRISMYILLPNDKFGLDDVETKLSQTKLHQLFSKVDAVKKDKVDLVLPKFKLEKTITLTDHLQKLGMARMFTNNADFSGITGGLDLYVSAVMQKAFIEVNEEGSEAAAATGMVMMMRSMPMPSPQFVCDHPFMFFIRDKLTDMVLFSGRVVDPTST